MATDYVTPIKAALEACVRTALAAGFTDRIEYENEPYTPAADEAFVIVTIDFADHAAVEYGSTFQAQGVMDVIFMYPVDQGSGPADAAGALVRAACKRGTSLPAVNGIVTQFGDHPRPERGFTARGRYATPVRVRFYANVTA